MKLLFDQNISFRITKKINPVFPNSKHVRELALEDASDIEIWRFAKQILKGVRKNYLAEDREHDYK